MVLGLQVLYPESKAIGLRHSEISCAALQSDYTEDKQLLELKKCAEETV